MRKIVAIGVGFILTAMPFVASADAISHALSVGSRSGEVTTLQQVLIALGFFKSVPSGYYGPLTRQAVSAYQKANGLEQTGSVGPKTRAKINAYLSSFAPASVPASSTSTAQVPVATNNASTAPQAASPIVPATSPNDPPKITLVSPQAKLPRATQQTVLTISTDKPALCRYGTQPGMLLTYMTSFTYTGATSHSVTFSNLSPDALYVYYVRCEDNAGHISADTTVSFSLTQSN